MADLRKYWQELRAIEAGLEEFVWLMSVANPSKGQVGGSMVEVAAALAAKLLYAKSHRLATDEETEAHLSQQEEVQRQTFQQRLRDKGIAVVPVK
jgi:hypothetical protein